ncbi:MAG: hypothetical protein ACFFD5_08615 [Candidatus Thorarchaeota archaeon]
MPAYPRLTNLAFLTAIVKEAACRAVIRGCKSLRWLILNFF